MSNLTSEQVVKAWRDPEYRQTLSSEQLSEFQGMSEEQIAGAFADPSLAIELTDDELEAVAGGLAPTIGSCNMISCF
ncbi:MAG: mersacidin/lichenicidin family type 2 lantibiotic [Anaerolineae bacterium]|nr:mersacidin/lichenicidin family type 2 lantibiotic [Anaerolineae bacterium]